MLVKSFYIMSHSSATFLFQVEKVSSEEVSFIIKDRLILICLLAYDRDAH